MTVARAQKFPVAGLWVRLAHARQDGVDRAGRGEVAARFNADGEDKGQQKARRLVFRLGTVASQLGGLTAAFAPRGRVGPTQISQS